MEPYIYLGRGKNDRFGSDLGDFNEIWDQFSQLWELGTCTSWKKGIFSILDPLRTARMTSHKANQVEEKSIQLNIIYMLYVQFSKPNREHGFMDVRVD